MGPPSVCVYSGLRLIRLFLTALLVTVLLGGLFGRMTRDRTVLLALMMYIPLPLVGLSAIVLDLVLKGRAIRPRFALLLTGLCVTALSVRPLVTFRTAMPSTSRHIKLLHWNVQWGGGWKDGDIDTWQSIWNRAQEESLGILLLSEGPPNGRLELTARDIGWSWVSWEHKRLDPYIFRLHVCSRWSVKRESTHELPSGKAMIATVAAPDGALSIMIVDGISNPKSLRAPLLNAVADLLRQCEVAGRPVDVVAGDFNCIPSNSGFEAIGDAGFTLAAAETSGWRGTFPSILPLYDIDHVWLRNLTPIQRHLIRSRYTNHLGQAVMVAARETQSR